MRLVGNVNAMIDQRERDIDREKRGRERVGRAENYIIGHSNECTTQKCKGGTAKKTAKPKEMGERCLAQWENKA